MLGTLMLGTGSIVAGKAFAGEAQAKPSPGKVNPGRLGQVPRGLEEALKFPLVEALLGRRARRFSVGSEIPDGPVAFKSTQPPLPLDPLEQMLVLTAAAGNTGWHHMIDLALKARRALGDALGRLLVAPDADQEAIARQASDVVDDALALIRYWSAQTGTSFYLLAMRFFRFGVQLYRFHQPHFLAEFIDENLSLADAEFKAIALEAIDATLSDGPGSGQFLTIGDPVSERRRQTWNDLAALRNQLTA